MLSPLGLTFSNLIKLNAKKILYFEALADEARNTGFCTRRYTLTGFPRQPHTGLEVCRWQLGQGTERGHFQIVTVF